jgi:hypothetical protein
MTNTTGKKSCLVSLSVNAAERDYAEVTTDAELLRRGMLYRLPAGDAVKNGAQAFTARVNEIVVGRHGRPDLLPRGLRLRRLKLRNRRGGGHDGCTRRRRPR